MKKLQVEGEEVTPVISDNQWKNAIEKLKQQYRNSECLPLILDILTAFAETNARKYRTDFDMFLHESKIEDFIRASRVWSLCQLCTSQKAESLTMFL